MTNRLEDVFNVYNASDIPERVDTLESSLISRPRKNLIINGNFDVWQRGSSAFGVSNGQYVTDRWYTGIAGASTNANVARQDFIVGQTEVPNEPKYYHRTDIVNGGTGSSDYASLCQPIEGVRTLAGQTATISFYAKIDVGTADMSVELAQLFGGGGLDYELMPIQKVTLTSTWQKFVLTVDIFGISGKTIVPPTDNLLLIFWMSAGSDFDDRTYSLGLQTGIFDIAQVQIELGDTATDFEYRTYGEELVLCQRYYWENSGSIYGAVYATGNSFLTAFFPTTMRVVPTITSDPITNTGTPSTIYVSEDNVQHLITGDTSTIWGAGDIVADAEL